MKNPTEYYTPVNLVILLVAISLLTNTFSSSSIEVFLEIDGDIEVYLLEKSFWGIKKDWYEVKYFPQTREQIGGWYLKYKTGEWNHWLNYY